MSNIRPSLDRKSSRLKLPKRLWLQLRDLLKTVDLSRAQRTIAIQSARRKCSRSHHHTAHVLRAADGITLGQGFSERWLHGRLVDHSCLQDSGKAWAKRCQIAGKVWSDRQRALTLDDTSTQGFLHGTARAKCSQWENLSAAPHWPPRPGLQVAEQAAPPRASGRAFWRSVGTLHTLCFHSLSNRPGSPLCSSALPRAKSHTTTAALG